MFEICDGCKCLDPWSWTLQHPRHRNFKATTKIELSCLLVHFQQLNHSTIQHGLIQNDAEFELQQSTLIPTQESNCILMFHPTTYKLLSKHTDWHWATNSLFDVPSGIWNGFGRSPQKGCCTSGGWWFTSNFINDNCQIFIRSKTRNVCLQVERRSNITIKGLMRFHQPCGPANLKDT